jgi:hypothetical protein
MGLMYQCRLRRGDAEIVGWISERGAKLGALVELIDDDNKLWEVVKVYLHGMDESLLKERQRLDRGSLSSIK